MGCDGGTIPRRDELVRVKKKPEQKDKESELSFRWRHCTISQQPLQSPIVACGLGRIYCKESVLEGLLDRSKLPETASHITSLKDVRELVLTANPAYARQVNGEKGESGRYVDHRTSPYSCPVIGLELSGKFRFAFPWSCGCVVSDKALKEVPSKLCHKCQKPVTPEEFVYLNAEGEVLKQMQARMEERRALAKASKKIKKDKKQKQPASATVTTAEDSTLSTEVVEASISPSIEDNQKQDTKESNTPMEIHFVAAKEPEDDATKEESNDKTHVENVDLTKVKKEVPEEIIKDKEETWARKRSHSPQRSESKHDHREKHDKDEKYKREHRDNRKSSKDRKSRGHRSSRDDPRSSKDRKHKDHKSGKNEAICDPAYKKSKSEYSVANDPRASKVYKSLFTSHADAKSQTKAHWVTYNPFYN